MRIDLTNYNATPASTFRIYRSYSTFTELALPTRLAEIPATETEYLDNTVELNRLVYYRISVVHNGVEIVGPLYTTMKKFYTGPQVNVARSEPDSILRGNAEIGRYGTLPMASVYAASQIPEDFPTLTIIEGVDVDATNVEKCIYDDKILFISDKPMYMGSLEDLYKVGMLFGNGDADGKSLMTTELYDSITTKVQQGKLIHSNGFTYRPRLMTESEYLNVYTKLYPTSVRGLTQDKVIANCQPHTAETIVLPKGKAGKVDNLTMTLTGTVGRTDWVSKRPLQFLLELVSRADSAFPDPGIVIKPVLPEDRMMMCGGELANNRVHFFGGIYSTFTTGMTATDRHISFDLNGEDEQVHAPMPFGVYSPVTWTHDNKIYSFGGVRKIGTTEYSYQELYDNVQVWEDNGTPEGLWTVLTTNVPFAFGSCGTVYYDDGLQQTRIIVIGGFNTIQPNITDNYYSANVVGFDGTFESNKSYFSMTTGGGVVAPYEKSLMWVAPARTSNSLTNNAYRILTPIGQPPLWPRVTSVVTQGTELPPTRKGKLFTWRDTLFYVTEASFTNTGPWFYIYQWAPNESRWLRIQADAPGLNQSNWWMGTTVALGGRVFVLVSLPFLNADQVSKLMVIDLIDPIEAPLVPINAITPVVDRIYPPYAQVKFT